MFYKRMIAVCVAAVLLLGAGCGQQEVQEEAPTGTAVEVLSVTPGPMKAEYAVTGKVTAVNEVQVFPLLAGQVLTLSVEPGEAADYELTIEDGSGVYTETGYTWCSYNYPEEGLYGEDFPPEQYDSFLLSLYTEDFSYTGGGAVPERYAPGEYGGHWFVLYYARETGAVVLEDMDDTGLFQSERYLPLSTLEHG